MSDLEEIGRRVITIAVRFAGLLLLTAGLWVALQILQEVFTLYQDPAGIDRFASAVEAGSNIDKEIATLRGNSSTRTLPGNEPASDRPFRPSYLFAWLILLLLLALTARIALAAIKTGGELALYNIHTKRTDRS